MASTFSFDVVSDFDRQELVNTLDQVRRDVGNRYDLKDSNTEIELEETTLGWPSPAWRWKNKGLHR